MDEEMTDERKHPEGELTRLADGTLPDDRQADLLAQIRHSPQLTADLAEQERAVTMLRALDEPAPAALRARVNELTSPAASRRAPRWRRAFVLPGAIAIAAAVAAVVILVSGGAGTPTVPTAARLALASATLPAPAADPNDAENLTLSAAGIPFPAWGPQKGWTATGARTDTVDGRRVTTVFYTGRTGKRIGYAITDGAPLSGAQGRQRDPLWRALHPAAVRAGAPDLLGALGPHLCDRGALGELPRAADAGHRRRAPRGRQRAGGPAERRVPVEGPRTLYSAEATASARLIGDERRTRPPE